MRIFECSMAFCVSVSQYKSGQSQCISKYFKVFWHFVRLSVSTSLTIVIYKDYD